MWAKIIDNTVTEVAEQTDNENEKWFYVGHMLPLPEKGWLYVNGNIVEPNYQEPVLWKNDFEPHPWVKVIDSIVVETAKERPNIEGDEWFYVGHKSVTPEKGWIFKNQDIVPPTKYSWIRLVDETVVRLHYFKDLKLDSDPSHWLFIPEHLEAPTIGWKFIDGFFVPQ